MSPSARIAAILLAPLGCTLFASSGRAQFPEVRYEVLVGSSLVESCGTCERPDIWRPITGTFVLQRLAVRIVGELYELRELSLFCAGCDVSIAGTGRIHLPDPGSITPSLDVTIDGASVQLEAANSTALAPWPLIDVTVSEDGSRDPGRRYTLRLIAAPEVESVPYKLVPGSLVDGSGSLLEIVCPVCRPRYPYIPLEGTFSVGAVTSIVDGRAVYRLTQIQLVDTLDDVDYRITGSGSYEEGGDATITKVLRLAVEVNEPPVRDFDSEVLEVKPGEGFPTIDVEAEELLKESLWYRIHLVAKPAGSTVEFRRGDANADGLVDIADPIFALAWSFAGGPAPTCLDAADTDADGRHNLTDAIFELQYLFLGGPALPAPGPQACGSPPTPEVDCAAYDACAPA